MVLFLLFPLTSLTVFVVFSKKFVVSKLTIEIIESEIINQLIGDVWGIKL